MRFLSFLTLTLLSTVCGTQAQPSFPPLSDYVSLGGAYWDSRSVNSSVIPSGNSGRTITAWVFMADNSTTQVFWGQNALSGGCDSRELSVGFFPGSGFGATACNIASVSSQLSSYSLGTWYHVAFTYDSTNQQATLAVNGQPGQTQTWRTLATSNDRVVIGARLRSDQPNVNGLVTPWQGVVASVHTYGQVLTQGQILADMYSVSPLPVTPTLMLQALIKPHWPAVPSLSWLSNTAQSLPVGLPDSLTPTYQSLSGQYWEARNAPFQLIPSGNSARTITAWVYLAQNNQITQFWGQNSLSGGCNSRELSVGYFPGTGFWASSCNIGSVSSQLVSYPAGTWYHVAFTWDSTLQQATLAVNGQPGAAQTWSPLATSNERVVIGARLLSDRPNVNGIVQPWQGVVATLTAYGQVLTQAQIVQDMNGNKPVTPALALQATAQPTWTVLSTAPAPTSPLVVFYSGADLSGSSYSVYDLGFFKPLICSGCSTCPDSDPRLPFVPADYLKHSQIGFAPSSIWARPGVQIRLWGNFGNAGDTWCGPSNMVVTQQTGDFKNISHQAYPTWVHDVPANSGVFQIYI